MSKKTKSARRVMDELLAGNERFMKGRSLQSSHTALKKLKTFAKTGQFPKAIILCCSDSRAPVEMIFDQGIGDLFVIRVAGNVVAPELIGSVEFAISAFGTQTLLVMGHTGCGAIGATLDHIKNLDTLASENIHDLVSRIKPHIFTIAQMKGMSHKEKMNHAVEANVRASVGQLSHSSRLIEKLLATRKLRICGAILNLSTGKVNLLKM